MEIEQIKWFLTELGARDAEDIESNDLEIMGEDANGVEGAFTVQINELAEQASEYIHELESKLRKCEEKITALTSYLNDGKINAAMAVIAEMSLMVNPPGSQD